MARDQYRQKLYEAERAAFRFQPRVSRTIEDCAARIEEVQRTSHAFRTACSDYQLTRSITVEAARGGTSWANSGLWRIQVSNWHRGNDWVLLHEMAHLPTHCAFQAHGREFCSLYLKMAREAYGAEPADRLRDEMKARGVPFMRTLEYERQLRGYFRQVAKPDYGATNICVVTTSGRSIFVYGDRPRLEGDTVYLGSPRSRTMATPDSIDIGEVAYLTWSSPKRVRKEVW